MVIGTIAINFFTPEIRSRSGQLKERAVMSMPEASVYEYDRMIARQHNIGLSR